MRKQLPEIWRRLTRKLRHGVNYVRAEIAFALAYRKIKSIEGFLVDGQERWLFEATRSLPRRATIVEIGAYLGRATACMALGCKGTERHVFSIDLFGGVHDGVRNSINNNKFDRNFFQDWQENMSALRVLRYVTPIHGDSKRVANSWKAPIHMLFIDGSHNYEDVIADFENFLPYVLEGGTVGIHDVTLTWPGPYRAWHEKIRHQLVDVGSCASLAFGRKPRVR